MIGILPASTCASERTPGQATHVRFLCEAPPAWERFHPGCCAHWSRGRRSDNPGHAPSGAGESEAGTWRHALPEPRRPGGLRPRRKAARDTGCGALRPTKPGDRPPELRPRLVAPRSRTLEILRGVRIQADRVGFGIRCEQCLRRVLAAGLRPGHCQPFADGDHRPQSVRVGSTLRRLQHPSLLREPARPGAALVHLLTEIASGPGHHVDAGLRESHQSSKATTAMIPTSPPIKISHVPADSRRAPGTNPAGE